VLGFELFRMAAKELHRAHRPHASRDQFSEGERADRDQIPIAPIVPRLNALQGSEELASAIRRARVV
jgi:hypothetical protein